MDAIIALGAAIVSALLTFTGTNYLSGKQRAHENQRIADAEQREDRQRLSEAVQQLLATIAEQETYAEMCYHIRAEGHSTELVGEIPPVEYRRHLQMRIWAQVHFIELLQPDLAPSAHDYVKTVYDRTFEPPNDDQTVWQQINAKRARFIGEVKSAVEPDHPGLIRR